MIKNVLALCIVFSSNVYALDIISEDELSSISAQDGITMLVGLPSNGWRANEISLTDTNGISASIMAGYATAGTIAAKNVGFNTCSQTTINGACSPLLSLNAPTLRFDMDMVGDNNVAVGGGAMLNISFSLMGGANKIRFYIDKIVLSNSAGANGTPLIDFGGRTGADIDPSGDYIDIVPIGSSTLFAVQLGSESLGHMLHFTNGNFGTIDFGVVSFVDAQNNANSLRFGLKLDEFDITGTGFDINPDGLLYTAADFGKGLMDITISDIKMGGASAASMGTIGLQNISITNLAVTVSGKL